MEKELKEIILATYLHDVGKFAQRAEQTCYYEEKMEGLYGKLQKGGWYSHKHAVFTEGFLYKHREAFPSGVDVSNVVRLAASHHCPSQYDEWLIAHGDRLSSGLERCTILETESAEYANEQNDKKYYETPMVHILSSLKLGENKTNLAFCKMQPLDDDAILATDAGQIGHEEYKALWKQFEADFIKLKDCASSEEYFDDYLNALDTLLERYWWCIPSATNVDADISLYQHSKMTAAFAACLYYFQKEQNKKLETELYQNDEKKFRFIKGDISGIQKYIFDLKSHDDSSKLLRAKSFEIAALGELVSRYIINSFELPSANIITSAGGNFMILLPNTQKVQELLPQIQLETESYFLKEYAGRLSVIISDGVEASCNDVKQANAQKLINDIGYNTDIAKQKKMQKAIHKNGSILEEFYSKLQANGECVKCGVFPRETNSDECEHCKALTRLGSGLVKSNFLSYNVKSLTSLGTMISVSIKPQVHASIINTFNSGLPRIYLPYTVPKDDNGNIFTFSDIAKKSCGGEDKGIKKLAMFKADIDNLGLIFSSSLGNRMSFSRYADMSHTLNYFFSTYFVHFVETHNYRDYIYTVFSGGDDLCVIGAWDKVMQFANDFQKEIDKLTNNNPSVTLSGGIVLSSSSTPVAMIAEMAENALEKSKERKENSKTVKNAITVFGTTVSWSDYEKCLNDGKQFKAYLDDKTLSSGVVYKMIDFANRAANIDKGNIEELINLRSRTWKSNFKYIVARNVTDEEAKKWILKFGSSSEEMIKSRIAVSYALYTQRKD